MTRICGGGGGVAPEHFEPVGPGSLDIPLSPKIFEFRLGFRL